MGGHRETSLFVAGGAELFVEALSQPSSGLTDIQAATPLAPVTVDDPNRLARNSCESRWVYRRYQTISKDESGIGSEAGKFEGRVEVGGKVAAPFPTPFSLAHPSPPFSFSHGLFFTALSFIPAPPLKPTLFFSSPAKGFQPTTSNVLFSIDASWPAELLQHSVRAAQTLRITQICFDFVKQVDRLWKALKRNCFFKYAIPELLFDYWSKNHPDPRDERPAEFAPPSDYYSESKRLNNKRDQLRSSFKRTPEFPNVDLQSNSNLHQPASSDTLDDMLSYYKQST